MPLVELIFETREDRENEEYSLPSVPRVGDVLKQNPCDLVVNQVWWSLDRPGMVTLFVSYAGGDDYAEEIKALVNDGID